MLLAPSDRRWEGTAFTPSRPNIAKESRLHPNESCLYFGAGGHPRNHPQLGRGDAHHNTAETLKATNGVRKSVSALPRNASTLS